MSHFHPEASRPKDLIKMKYIADTNKKIAYLGIAGSYSYIAALKYFGQQCDLAGYSSFTEVINSVKNSKADVCVLPLENSLSGSIYESYDLLIESKLNIIGEIIIKIEHCLLVKNTSIVFNNLKMCLTQAEIARQCKTFISKHNQMKIVFTADSATAVKELKAAGEGAAIGNRLSAQLYGLKVLRTNIADNIHNYTRFVIVSKKKNKSGDKVSLAFSVAHTPGSLFSALDPYARMRLNLTKIESRPVYGKPWEYLFLVDFELNENKLALRTVLLEMKKHVNFIKILGLYEKSKIRQS